MAAKTERDTKGTTTTASTSTSTVILTCYNRSQATVSCVRSLNSNINVSSYIIVDDSSSDDTLDRLQELSEAGMEITVLHVDGSLYYSGGMRMGIDEAKKREQKTAYYLIVNDDVEFEPGIIDRMIDAENRYFIENRVHEVLIGCTCSDTGELTYGGIRYTGRGISYRICPPGDSELCDTFNANCVLIPKDIFLETENIDLMYIHSLGDFDYGLSMSRSGVPLRVFEAYVGHCNDNGIHNTWMDRALKRIERIKRKESPKGAPFRQWLYYLKKNFGLKTALLHGFTPYLRILAGK